MMPEDPWWRWRTVEPDEANVTISKRGRPERSPLRRNDPGSLDAFARNLFQRWRWS